MIKIVLILFFTTVLFAQENGSDWLNHTIVDKKIEVSQEKKDNLESYYTIQVAAKKTFKEAMNVVEKLNSINLDAFIQKNDENVDLKYRVRYGNFSVRDDAESVANMIDEELNYNSWIDRIDL
tara:strand:+ start:268 stop:636 length:369 start_codon:yes stop_codon:yes gene_type:complete